MTKVQLTLLPIQNDWKKVSAWAEHTLVSSVCEATIELYSQFKEVGPWGGFLATIGNDIVGSCGFKGPPNKGLVEIAYFTFPDFEGRGIATEMARQMLTKAYESNSNVRVVAQTEPRLNASTRILQKLGFHLVGTAIDHEIGTAWEWRLDSLPVNSQNATRKPTWASQADGQSIAVVGDVYRFVTTGIDTNGTYATFEAFIPPGGGPPPHIHRREEESFFVLEGEVTFTVEDSVQVGKAGYFANMPVGTLHAFKNMSDKPARMLISVAPAGLEMMFFEVGTPIAWGATPPPPTHEEVERLLKAAPRFGVEIKLPVSDGG